MDRHEFIDRPKLIEVVLAPRGVIFRVKGMTLCGTEEIRQTLVEGLTVKMLSLEGLAGEGTTIIDYTDVGKMESEEVEAATAMEVFGGSGFVYPLLGSE